MSIFADEKAAEKQLVFPVVERFQFTQIPSLCLSSINLCFTLLLEWLAVNSGIRNSVLLFSKIKVYTESVKHHQPKLVTY